MKEGTLAPTIFYALILPLCTTLMAGGFVICWRWKPLQRDLLWLASCFALFSLGVTVQILAIPAALDANAVLSAALYHMAAWCLGEAMNTRFHAPMRRSGAAAAGALALGALTYYAYADDQLLVRIYVLNFGLATQLALSTTQLWRAPAPHALERALRILFAVFLLSFLVRTLLTVPQMTGLTAHNFGRTPFWIALQLSLLVFAMLFAMLYLALAIHQAMAQLHDERNRDPLTQLLNRRAFLETLERQAPQGPLGTIMVCDVDHFKQINDRWGHAAGDAVLQNVAQLLRGCVRDTDLIARYGGEEFVLLLQGMPLEAGTLLAERICQRLAHATQPALPPLQRVTVSIGLARVPSLAGLHSAIAQADRQLYAAKAAGRNCIRWQADAPAPAATTAPTPPAATHSSASTH